MNKDRKDFNAIYSGNITSRSVNKLKFWLMPFVMFMLFGFPTELIGIITRLLVNAVPSLSFISGIPSVIGDFVTRMSSFAAPAFLILSGFFILVPDKEARTEKLKSSVKRYLIVFAVLFVVYFLINIIYFYYVNFDWVTALVRKRVLFNIVALCSWPFSAGGTIWFVQSLLYACVFFFVADKLRLLEKAWFRIALFVFLAAVTLFSGEFAKIAGFPYFRYQYLPEGVINRSLPYMMIGMFIRRNANVILNIKRWIFCVSFAAGVILAALELDLLQHFGLMVYAGHTVGFTVMAVSVCCLALSKTDSKRSFFSKHGKNYPRRMYYLCQPVYLGVMLLAYIYANDSFTLIMGFGSIIVFFVCLILAGVFGQIRYAIFKRSRRSKPPAGEGGEVLFR